jgi:hypothetical protein
MEAVLADRYTDAEMPTSTECGLLISSREFARVISAAEAQRSVLTLLNRFYGKLSVIMSTAKQEVESLLSKLPDDCSLEDIQYHLYVIEKVRNGLEAADSQGSVSQDEVERRLGKWLTE